MPAFCDPLISGYMLFFRVVRFLVLSFLMLIVIMSLFTALQFSLSLCAFDLNISNTDVETCACFHLFEATVNNHSFLDGLRL